MKGRGFRVRLCLMAMAVLALSGSVTARLVHLQIQNGAFFRHRALQQRERVHALTPRRGDILDRHGRELAISVPVEAVAARPASIENPSAAARRLARILDLPAAEIEGKLRSSSTYVYLRRKATPQQCRAVREANIAGIELEPWIRRIYPNQTLAAHTLGFVRVDSTPLGGVELAFNEAIRGTPGRAIDLTDAKGASFSHRVVSEAVPGDTLQLNLDLRVQHILEEELAYAARLARASAGAAVVLDPATGEVLAMASWPTFNPNTFSEYSVEDRRDRAVVNAYEPGSTFKVITAAAALESGVVHPNDVFFCGNGLYKIGRYRIRDHKSFADLTFTQVIARSSNVGAIKAGMRMEPQVFHDFIRRFGFGQPTGVGLRAEHPGLLRPTSEWSLLSQPALSMGQEILVSPLQVISAFGAIANEGVLVRPWLARSLRGADGHVLERFAAPVPRRVISPQTARTLTTMLISVVEEGTGKAAAVPGYTVAGKTGTAQKSSPDKRGYLADKYVASFAGYVPARAPRLAAIFVIDEPGVPAYHGGDVAAPAFSRFAARALPALGIAPTPGTSHHSGAQRLVVRPSRETTRTATRWASTHRPVAGAGNSSPEDADAPAAVLAAARRSTPAGRMPALVGLTSREAVAHLTSMGMVPRLTGAGRVSRQEPAAGAALPAADEGCQLWLQHP